MDKCLMAITVLMTDDEACKAIGSRVALMRTRKGLSEEDLSKVSGLSLEELRRVEKEGDISLRALVGLARAMNADTYGALDQMFRSPKFKSLAEYVSYWEEKKDEEEENSQGV